MAEVKAAWDRVDAPFGFWALDVEKLELRPHCQAILLSSTISFAIYKDVYFVKVIENGVNWENEPELSRVSTLKQEIFMMLMAGEDCSLQPVGRVFLRGVLCGFIVPLGVTITHELPFYFHNKDKLQASPSLLLPSPKEQIDALTQLVSRLHTRGVIHGDIKPSNLIFCKETSRILFCDFGSAALENGEQRQISNTTQYISSFRSRPESRRLSLRKADDFYATGITIWEISAGCVPFDDIDEDFLEDVVASGFQPNLYAVPDTATRQLVHSYLEAGQEPLLRTSICKSREVCITADVVFTDCVAHTYEKTVHTKDCCEAKCDVAYRAPAALSHMENINCEKCLSM